jgi:hypothetical protein
MYIEDTLPDPIRETLTVLPDGPCSLRDLREAGPTDARDRPVILLPDDGKTPDTEALLAVGEKGPDVHSDRREIRRLLVLSAVGAYRVRYDASGSGWTVDDAEEWGLDGSMAAGLERLLR